MVTADSSKSNRDTTESRRPHPPQPIQLPLFSSSDRLAPLADHSSQKPVSVSEANGGSEGERSESSGGLKRPLTRVARSRFNYWHHRLGTAPRTTHLPSRFVRLTHPPSEQSSDEPALAAHGSLCSPFAPRTARADLARVARRRSDALTGRSSPFVCEVLTPFAPRTAPARHRP